MRGMCVELVSFSFLWEARGILITGLETVDLIACPIVNFFPYWAVRKEDFEIIIKHRVAYGPLVRVLSRRQNNNILVSAVWSVNQDIGLARGKFRLVYHSYIWEKFLVALLWQGS